MCFTICAVHWVRQVGVLVSKGPAMSFTRKTLKILALIYFVLGIASLGHRRRRYRARGRSRYPRTVRTPRSQRSCLSPRVVVDLAAGVAGIKGANKPSQVDGAFKLGIVAAVATLAQAVLTLPASWAATPSTLAPLSSWCTTCSLFSRYTPLRPRTRTA